MKKSNIAVAALIAISSITPVIAQEISPGLRASLPLNKPLYNAKNPIIDKNGGKLYFISLNPFVIDEYNKSKMAAEIIRNRKDESLDPGVIIVAQRLERNYNISIADAYSVGDVVIFAVMSDQIAEKVLRDEAVVAIRELEQQDYSNVVPDVLSIKKYPIASSKAAKVTNANGDTVLQNGELVTWAKEKIQGTQNPSSGIPITIVDGTPLYRLTGTSPIINGYTSFVHAIEPLNVNITTTPNGEELGVAGAYGGTHGIAVAGIIGAKQNSSGIVGMNPGQTINYSGGRLLDYPNINNTNNNAMLNYGFYPLMANALLQSENTNTFGVLSHSVNAANYQYLSFSPMGRVMRQASNRFLITHSAGNNGDDACIFAYNHEGQAIPDDGIMVIGGSNKNDQPFSNVSNPPWYNSDTSSNYGNCIDAWAPGQDIVFTSFMYDEYLYSSNPYVGVIQGTGTSFAAPITAAVASRYGNSSTRPIQRERFIRSNLSGNQVRYPSVLNTSNIPSIIPYTATAATANLVNAPLMYDGKFTTNGHWAADSNNGNIAIRLNQVKNVDGVRISLRTSDAAGQANPNGQILNAYPGKLYISVFQKVNGSWTNQRSIIETEQVNGAPIFIPLNYTNAQELLIWGQNDSSWFAIGELEVYGR